VDGFSFRPFDPAGRDLEILQAISNPPLKISGFTKKMLRQHLSGKWFAIRLSEKHLSAKISRQLRMLQTHGLLRKLPRQNKYQLTIKGMRFPNMLLAFLLASTENLLKIAEKNS